MPCGIDGIETARRLREVAPEVRVVALTASTDEALMAGVLRVGACGSLPTLVAPDRKSVEWRLDAAG